jgi:hypothetical protein
MTKLRQFLDAASIGDLRLMKKLFRSGNLPGGIKIDADAPDPDYWGDTALIKAAEEGHYEVCKFLIEEAGASVLKKSETDNLLPSYKAWFFEHRVVYNYLKTQEHIALGLSTPLQVRIHQKTEASNKGEEKKRLKRLFSKNKHKRNDGMLASLPETVF